MSYGTAELLADQAFVRRLARSLTADEGAADDLVQDTWVAALERYPDHSGLRAWVVRVLRNLAASRLRGEDRRETRERACARPETQPDTTELVARVELHHRLVAGVLGLPDAYREVVLRHYYRGESTRALAISLGKPEATVRTRLRRARQQLRRDLGGRFFEGEYAAFATALGTLDSATHWTEWTLKELVMRKALIQIPLIVGGFVGAGIGFGGSLLIRGEPSSERRGGERPAQDVLVSSAAEPPVAAGPRAAEPELSMPARVPIRPSVPETASPAAWTSDDLRRLLRSSDRLDQVQAIRFLTEDGTGEAHAILLESFLTTGDAILLALLEEAVLASGVDVAPIVFESYLASLDPERLQRLTSMLGKLVERDPGLEPRVVELLVGALADPGPNGERLTGLGPVLAALGTSALDALTDYLSDPLSDPAGVQTAAFVLASIEPAEAERVRERLGQTLDSLLAAAVGGELTDEQHRAVLERTSSMAWAASSRPVEEHDLMSEMLVGHLFRAADQQQAQTLGWGITSLKGLSDQARSAAVRSILDALPDQESSDLRQSYVWTVSQLATQYGTRPLDRNFHDIRRMVEDALLREDGAWAAQLRWLWDELERHREKKSA